VLQAIDDQLEAFGLEIVQYESGSDMVHLEVRTPRTTKQVRAARIGEPWPPLNPEITVKLVGEDGNRIQHPWPMPTSRPSRKIDAFIKEATSGD
jgi:hypothetical protein